MLADVIDKFPKASLGALGLQESFSSVGLVRALNVPDCHLDSLDPPGELHD